MKKHVNHSRSLNRSLYLLIAALWGSGYLIFLGFHFTELFMQQGTAESNPWVGAVFAIMLPHAIISAVAVALNWWAWTNNGTGLALATALAYLVSSLLFLPFWYAIIVPVIMSGIGYFQVRNKNVAPPEIGDTTF